MTQMVSEERRAFRAGRVRLAFLTSAGSKALGLLVQFMAVPLAVRALGPERFGIYTMLVSALVWIDLGRLGIGPGLTRELAMAWNRDQREREQMLFANAMAFLLIVATVIGAVLMGVYLAGWMRIEAIFGPSALRFRSEIIAGMAVVGAFLVAQIVFSAGEAARSAYQDDFINNLMNTLANLASLGLIFGVALLVPTIWAFALAVFGSIALGKGVNLLWLLAGSRRYLLPRWRNLDRRALGALLGTSMAFWVIQLATLLMHNVSLVQLGRSIGAEGLTSFAVVFRLLQLLTTVVFMVSLPLWPAITDAAVRGDREWIVRAYRRLIAMAMMFCIAVAIGLAIAGPWLIPLWAGRGVRPDAALDAVLGVYFMIWMWNHCHSTVLFGLGRLWPVAGAMLAEGALVLVLAAFLIPKLGDLGTAVALCVAGISTTAWILPLLVRRALAGSLHISPDLPPAGVAASAVSEDITP